MLLCVSDQLCGKFDSFKRVNYLLIKLFNVFCHNVKCTSLFGNIIRLSKNTETLLRKNDKISKKKQNITEKFQKCKFQNRYVLQVERNQWHSNKLLVSCFGIGEKIWFWTNSLSSGGETWKFGQKSYKMMHLIAIFKHEKSIFLKF